MRNNTRLGYGLVQWSPSEEKYLKYKGMKADEINNYANTTPQELMDSQLRFLLETMRLEETETTGYEWMRKNVEKYYTKISPSQGTKKIMEVEEYISSDCDPGDLALVFQAHYERSGNHLEIRKNAAEKWYAYFSGENPSITLDDFAIKRSD